MSSPTATKLTVEDVSRLTLLLSIINNGDWQELQEAIENQITLITTGQGIATRNPIKGFRQ